MREIAEDVYLMEGLRGCNVYLLVSEDGLTSVDTGMTVDVDRIIAQMRGAGYAVPDLRRIVLTHAHGDHAGGAAALVRRSGAQVVAHRDEVPYIEQTKPLPVRSLIQRLLFGLGDRLVFRLAPCEVDRAVGDGDVVEALEGLRVVHAPGHTPGSMALHQPERRVLFCGDALFNAHPMTGRPGLRLPIPLVTVDTAEAVGSARKLSRLPVDVLCCGHGEPIVDAAGERMRALREAENL